MGEAVKKLLDRAVKQCKIDMPGSATIEINQYGDTWVQWSNSRRKFRFTVFKDGSIASGLYGKAK